MSASCQMCGKGKQRGNRVSHAKNRSKHVFKPNLQVRRVLDPSTGSGQEVKVKKILCSRCIKKLNKVSRS